MPPAVKGRSATTAGSSSKRLAFGGDGKQPGEARSIRPAASHRTAVTGPIQDASPPLKAAKAGRPKAAYPTR